MYLFSLCILITLVCLNGQMCLPLNIEYQLRTMDIDIIDAEHQGEFSIQFGIWSRYAPLQNIAQVGKIGQFDSNCFHYLSFVGKQTQILNFLYYDCLNYDSKRITKYIKFFDDLGEIHTYSLNLNYMEYENIWYFTFFVQQPQFKKFTFIIMKQQQILQEEILQITYPFKEKNLIYTIGGDINALFGSEQIKCSYFPGQLTQAGYFEIIRSQVSQYNDLYSLGLQLYKITTDYCQSNYDQNIMNHSLLTQFDLFKYQSPFSNMDTFQLAGWIRVKKIIGNEFQYKILKLTTNTQNSKLQDKNLSPIELSYFIKDQEIKIMLSTYSFPFPIVNVDFNNNPFLINKEVIINSKLSLWHYISIIQKNKKLYFKIQFYEGETITYYELEPLSVNHFSLINFLITIGNIENKLDQYLIFEINSFQFQNCYSESSFSTACDQSCLTCDGPTSSDCLTCSQSSKRYYEKSIKQCLCPYNSIADNDCLQLEDVKLEIPNSILIFQCPYGYFQVDNECFQCPSILNEQQITCLECLLNPKTWKDSLKCQTSFISQNGTPFTQSFDDPIFFTFDGIDLHYCQSCSQICLDDDCIMQDLALQKYQKIQLCSINFNDNCGICTLEACLVCKLLQIEFECLACYPIYELVDGKCERPAPPGSCKGINCLICNPSYFLTSDQLQCKLCDIKNCQFCFQFQTNDLTQSTLYRDFNPFQINEYTAIGCALCDQGFIYDFTKGQCQQKLPSIINCLRSFLNLQGVESCTLSAIDDFDIAPEIINCQSHIQNCKQCLKTPFQTIKCIICENGYKASIQTGQCEQCQIQFSTNCIEGDLEKEDYWVQLIQSFLIQFLPNNYYYPSPQQITKIVTYPLSCIDGYKKNSEESCSKYCDDNCLQCSLTFLREFYCSQCPLTYYGNPNYSIDYGTCLVCPQLCDVCQPRSPDEIKQINPYFEVTNENIKYTYTCLKAVAQNNVKLDPEFAVVSYCFDKDCSANFQYTVESPLQDFNNILQSQIDFCNQMGVKSFKLKYIFIDQTIINADNLLIQPNIKQSIFSMQNTYLEIQGQFNTIKANLSLTYFDTIEISEMIYQVQKLNSIILNNNNNPINLYFSNAIFQGSLIPVDFQIQVKLLNNLNVNQIVLKNLILQNIIWLKYISDLSETLIQVIDLTIANCSFQNASLVSFKQFSRSINIRKLKFMNSTFNQSTIVSFNYTNYEFSNILFLEDILIDNCTFINSIAFLNEGNQKMQINTLKIRNGYLDNSVLIQSNFDMILSNIDIDNNNFRFSYFIIANPNPIGATYFVFDNFGITYTTFSNSSLITIHEKSININMIIITLNNFFHSHIMRTLGSLNQKFLYDFKPHSLSIQDVVIYESDSYAYFSVYQINKLIIKNVTYINEFQKYKIQASTECWTPFKSISTLIYVQGYSKVQISDIYVKNQFSLDNSFIQIVTDILYSTNDLSINLNNITFYGNILIKSDLANFISLLLIYSEKLAYIQLMNLKFQENFLNQIVDDPSQIAAGLLFIDSQLSYVQIDSIISSSNGLTNSSYPFVAINSLTQRLNNILVNNHNVLSNQIWMKYYEIDIDSKITDFEISELIQQIFSIKTIGGFCQIATSQLLISNASLQNLQAQSSSFCHITTQGEGIIILHNIQIASASVMLQQTTQVDACLTISSINSLLNIQLKNIDLQNVYNRLGSSLITIYPSLKYNQISLFNISILDCFSLTNQIISVSFQEGASDGHFFYINNITVNFQVSGLQQYLQTINFPSKQEIATKIKFNNAMINLVGCEVDIQNFFITGILISPILMITDVNRMVIYNFYVQNIKLSYPFSLLQFTWSKTTLQKMVLQNFHIKNTTQLKLHTSEIINQSKQQTYIFFNCKFFQFISNVQKASYETIFNYLNENQDLIGSIISINGISQNSKVFLNQINLNKNDCDFCFNGLLTIEMKTGSLLKLSQFNCNYNKIKEYGCLVLKQQEQNSIQIVSIKDSLFTYNNGTIGSGLFTSNSLFKLNRVKFYQNFAQNKGGAIFGMNISNNFQIYKTQLLYNYAHSGGGIYFEGQNYLTNDNFKESLLQYNQADQFAQNLFESAKYLTLKINNQEMNSITYNDSERQYEILSYTQGKIDQVLQFSTSNALYLPSNQEISNYKIFNFDKLIFQSYITQISIITKNSLNEILVGSSLDKCYIHKNIRDTQLQQDIENLKLINVIAFSISNNEFDLSQMIVTFNPYSTENQVLQLLINCSSENWTNSLNYIINVRTFKCQLGEFFINNGCSLCNPLYGFYSVNYDVTQCSIFDKTKFDNITSNQIKLKKGFWRPNYFSNLIEECYKGIDNCVGGWNVSDSLCLQGHIGGLCEECDHYNIRGYGNFVKDDNKLCGKCDNSFTLLPFILLVFWSLISTLLTLISIKKTNKTFSILKTRTKLYPILFKLSQDFESIFLKMLLNYLWIFSTIYSFNISFDFSLSFINQVSSPSVSMATNLDCQLITIGKIHLIYLRIILMIIFIIIQTIVIFIGYKIYQIILKRNSDFSIITNTFIYLFVQNQAQLINSFGSLISPRNISGIDYVQGDVSLLFYNDNHLIWINYFILPGLIVIGICIPLTFFIILFFNQKRFNSTYFRKHLCYLFNEYNQECSFWEQIKILKRSTIIIIMTYFESSIIVKASLISLTLLSYQLLAVIYKPYVIKSLNRLDFESGYIVLTSIFLALMKYVSEQNNNETASMILQIIIVMLCLRLCYCFVIRIVSLYIKKYQPVILFHLQNLAYKWNNNSYFAIYFHKKYTKYQIGRQKLQTNYQKFRQLRYVVLKQCAESKRSLQINYSSQLSRKTFNDINKIMLGSLVAL